MSSEDYSAAEADPGEPAVPAGSGFRSYEIYQRERVTDPAPPIKPRQLISDAFLTDPYPLLAAVREATPCYRDWVGNRFVVTRYDDVTSVFVDDANYLTRPKAAAYAGVLAGRDLGDEVAVLAAITARTDAALPGAVEATLGALTAASGLGGGGSVGAGSWGDGSGGADLVTGFAARLPMLLWGAVLDLPPAQLGWFASAYWRLQRGAGWAPAAHQAGVAAVAELRAGLGPLLAARRSGAGDDLVSVVASLGVDGVPATVDDLIVTVLERDHETLHGGLANLWFQLLTRPGQLEMVRADRRMVKFAWLETLRHSPAVLGADRFTRHEVERFGRLLPEGALVHCSAAAANRDPTVFADPDRFDVARKDLCQREPRGQYRADGLPAGIAFGLGRPSPHPAEPRDRPRSAYALVRDVAVSASQALLDAFPALALAPGAEPTMRSLRLGEMHTCWSLPVQLG
jgi:pulcherriminic acid synthase